MLCWFVTTQEAKKRTLLGDACPSGFLESVASPKPSHLQFDGKVWLMLAAVTRVVDLQSDIPVSLRIGEEIFPSLAGQESLLYAGHSCLILENTHAKWLPLLGKDV